MARRRTGRNPGINPRLWSMIQGGALRFGLDPYAVAAVSRVEGGGRFGAVGDSGTSFGPFQLHRGGALPAGRGADWANSAAGVRYAMKRMAQSGARGKTGLAAIQAIVRNFERPADPDTEVKNAFQLYRKVGANPVSQQYAAMATGFEGGYKQKQVEARADLFTTNQLSLISRVGPLSERVAAGLSSMSVPESMVPQRGMNLKGTKMIGEALGGKAAMIQAIRQARRMGLHVGENPRVDRVDPVHVEGSWHYQTFGRGNVGKALDVSGDPKQLRRFAKWLIRNRAREEELYYDPLGGQYRIGGHGTHVHVAYK